MSKPEKLRVVLVEPGKYAREATVDKTLPQELAEDGGLIDAICLWPEDNVCLILNDTGTIMQTEPNRELPEYGDIAFGTFFLCGEKGEDFCSLTDEQVARYLERFRQPELFVPYQNGTLSIPYDRPDLPDAPESGLTEDAESPKVLREYLVPTFTFNGSFANVSGIDIQMKKDGDLVVFYGITYGKNGTISQVVTFGYWTNINEGVQDHRDDTQPDVTVEYQYTVTDPLRGYDFGDFYPELKVKAFYGDKETPVELTQNLAGGDTVYRSADYYAQKPDKFTVSTQHDEADLVIYAEYVQ